ncbi:MAG: hypothetical protein KGJ13_08120 [Patescibacteria group bacterium]|nr:hypothetical protein [Patescibacteria group bacterium]
MNQQGAYWTIQDVQAAVGKEIETSSGKMFIVGFHDQKWLLVDGYYLINEETMKTVLLGYSAESMRRTLNDWQARIVKS